MERKTNIQSAIMRYRVIVIMSLFINNVTAQRYDSVHVYAVPMSSMYRIKIDKDLIKNEVDPIIFNEVSVIAAIDNILRDTVKGNYLKKLKSINLDVRLSFEFFGKGVITKRVGLTPYGTMFINYKLYQ